MEQLKFAERVESGKCAHTEKKTNSQSETHRHKMKLNNNNDECDNNDGNGCIVNTSRARVLNRRAQMLAIQSHCFDGDGGGAATGEIILVRVCSARIAHASSF